MTQDRCRARGHLRTPENTRVEKTGWLRCLECRREVRRKTNNIRRGTSLPDRLAHYTDSSAGIFGCWEWTGARNSRGYPVIQWEGEAVYAHRAALELAVGEPLGESFACHRCDNKGCVNPAHLYVGDQLSNMRDMSERGRARNQWTGPIQ